MYFIKIMRDPEKYVVSNLLNFYKKSKMDGFNHSGSFNIALYVQMQRYILMCKKEL